MTFTDQPVKPFIGHAGETGDVVHVDQGIIGTQQYAVVACCGQHGQNVLSEIYEEWGNTGNGIACCFQHCQPGLPARQRASGSHTPRRSRAKSLNAQIRSLNRASQSGDRRSSTTSRVICFWYSFASPGDAKPSTLLQASSINRSSSGPSKYSCLTHSTTWYSGFSG